LTFDPLSDTKDKKEVPMTTKVYFTKDVSSRGIEKVFAKVSAPLRGKVAIKLHFGEPGNQCALKPELIKPLALKLQATFVDSNVLYAGPRRQAETHHQVALKHGFGFCPIDILDGDGEEILPAQGLNHYTQALVGRHFRNYDSYLIYSHVKGHIMSGMGAAIKNVAMGFASVSGKMAMHASAKPLYKVQKCQNCGRCVTECPVEAITLEPLNIGYQKCLGCGKCVGVCTFGAIDVDWGGTAISVFQERVAEYAKIISQHKPMTFINVAANITNRCDCHDHVPPPFTGDIGVLGSLDMLAIDQASYDLVNQQCSMDDAWAHYSGLSGMTTLNHAQKIGLGDQKYELISLD
jgi:uncharacterized protein